MCFVALKRKTHHFIHISFYFEVKKKKTIHVSNHTLPIPAQTGAGTQRQCWAQYLPGLLCSPGLVRTCQARLSRRPLATVTTLSHACRLPRHLIHHQAAAATLPSPPTPNTLEVCSLCRKAQVWRGSCHRQCSSIETQPYRRTSPRPFLRSLCVFFFGFSSCTLPMHT